MPARKDFAAWLPAEIAKLRYLSEEMGLGSSQAARRLNAEVHDGRAIRTATMVNLARSRHGILVNRRADAMTPPTERVAQTLDVKDENGVVTATAYGSEVRTIDELIARAKIDLTKYEVDRPETSMYETTIKTPEGKERKVQNFRIVARFRLKHGPNVKEQVEALLAGAFAPRKPLPSLKTSRGDAHILQGVVVNDLHVGKLSWPASTGGPAFDTGIAVETLRRGVTHLMAEGDARDVGQRHFWLLGDFFHHDGQGMTTGGTMMDYDSRVQKMLKSGTEVLFDLIAASAASVPTAVYLVPGNHDRTLTWALQRILCSEFRRHKGVTIDEGFTTTKYLRHGKCLIGLDHGDKGKKRLAAAMAHACSVEWGETTWRDIHTGHLHTKRRAATETDTIEGVTIYTHNALCPADQYHADEKFDTSPRTIEAFRYHAGGLCAGSDAWSPDLHAAPRRGTMKAA